MKKLALLLLVFTVALSAQANSPIKDDLAVRAIVGEAANQGKQGMLAVACALRNRGHLGGVYGVKNPVADKQPAWVWKQAQEAWKLSKTKDITGGADHWENVNAFGKPTWAKSMTQTVVIKDHAFFRSKKAKS